MMNTMIITKLSLQIPCPTTTITFFSSSTPHGRNRRTTPLLIPCHLRFHCKPNYSFMIKTKYMQTDRLDRVIHHPIILCRASPPENNIGNGKNSGEVLFKPGKIMVIKVAVLALCVIGTIMSSYRSTTALAKPRWGSTETTTTTTTTTRSATSSLSAQEAKHVGSIEKDLDNLISRGKEDLQKHTTSLTLEEDGDVRSLVDKWTRISGSHEKYECGLSLIEILIKKEQYDEAEKICSYYLQERGTEMQQMDERIVLRRFIIMLERARKHWKEYEDIMENRGGTEGPEDSPELD